MLLESTFSDVFLFSFHYNKNKIKMDESAYQLEVQHNNPLVQWCIVICK